MRRLLVATLLVVPSLAVAQRGGGGRSASHQTHQHRRAGSSQGPHAPRSRPRGHEPDQAADRQAQGPQAHRRAALRAQGRGAQAQGQERAAVQGGRLARARDASGPQQHATKIAAAFATARPGLMTTSARFTRTMTPPRRKRRRARRRAADQGKRAARQAARRGEKKVMEKLGGGGRRGGGGASGHAARSRAVSDSRRPASRTAPSTAHPSLTRSSCVPCSTISPLLEDDDPVGHAHRGEAV